MSVLPYRSTWKGRDPPRRTGEDPEGPRTGNRFRGGPPVSHICGSDPREPWTYSRDPSGVGLTTIDSLGFRSEPPWGWVNFEGREEDRKGKGFVVKGTGSVFSPSLGLRPQTQRRDSERPKRVRGRWLDILPTFQEFVYKSPSSIVVLRFVNDT